MGENRERRPEKDRRRKLMLKESKVFLPLHNQGSCPTIFKVTRVGLDWTGCLATASPPLKAFLW